jgi:hypothetical protein
MRRRKRMLEELARLRESRDAARPTREWLGHEFPQR